MLELSRSYPYLSIARHFSLPYGAVLSASDYQSAADHNPHAEFMAMEYLSAYFTSHEEDLPVFVTAMNTAKEGL